MASAREKSSASPSGLSEQRKVETEQGGAGQEP